MMEQAVKKAATGESLVKVEMQGGGSGFSITRGGSSDVLPTRFMGNENIPGSSASASASMRRDRFGANIQTSSLAVSRAWKKEVNAGHLLPKLFHLFGESMLPFVPSPELCNIFL